MVPNDITALLGVLSALVAALIWLVKTMQTNSNRLIEQRDREVSRLITALEKAVEAFSEFRSQQDNIHGEIVSDLRECAKVQGEVLQELRAMKEDI